eukprot:gene20169-22144_t
MQQQRHERFNHDRSYDGEPPKKLTGSFKFNLQLNEAPYNNNDEIYSLEQIDVVYKRKPIESTRTADYNGTGKTPFSTPRLMPLGGRNEKHTRHNGKYLNDHNNSMAQFQHSLPINSQQPYTSNEQRDFKELQSKNPNIRITEPAGKHHGVQQTLHGKPDKISSLSSSNNTPSDSKSVCSLIKEHSKLVQITKHCRSVLDQSIDEMSRRNYENRYLTAMEMIAVIENKLKDVNYGMIRSRNNLNDSRTSNYSHTDGTPIPIERNKQPYEMTKFRPTNNQRNERSMRIKHTRNYDSGKPKRDLNYDIIRKRKDFTPARNNVVESSRSTIIPKQEILSLAVELRKKYLQSKKKISYCRKTLQEKIATMKEKEQIETKYFSEQAQIESIRNQLRDLAEKLKCNEAKFFAALNIDEYEGNMLMNNGSFCCEKDKKPNWLLTKKLFSETSSDDSTLYQNDFEFCDNDEEFTDRRFLPYENYSHEGFEFGDNYYDQRGLSMIDSASNSTSLNWEQRNKLKPSRRRHEDMPTATNSTCTAEERRLKSTAVQTDDNLGGYFDERTDASEMSLKSRNSSASKSSIVNAEEQRDEDMHKPLQNGSFLSLNESETLERLRSKRLAFFQQDHSKNKQDSEDEFNSMISSEDRNEQDQPYYLPQPSEQVDRKEIMFDNAYDTGSDASFEEWNKNNMICDVADIKPHDSGDAILYEGPELSSLSDDKEDLDNNNINDFDYDDKYENVKLYDADDFETDETEIMKKKVRDALLQLKPEPGKMNSEVLLPRESKEDAGGRSDGFKDDIDLKLNTMSSRVGDVTDEEQFLPLDNSDEEKDQLQQYKSIVDIDYRDLFPSEQAMPDKKIERKGDDHPILSEVLKKDQLIEEPEIQAIASNEEQASVIDYEKLLGFDEDENEIKETQKDKVDEEDDVEKIKLSTIIPSLRDSINEEEMQDQDTEKYLDFVLDDHDDEVDAEMAAFAKGFANEDDKTDEIITQCEEDQSDMLDVMTPRPDTLPVESNLALSLQQSLDLLDELEAFEATSYDDDEDLLNEVVDKKKELPVYQSDEIGGERDDSVEILDDLIGELRVDALETGIQLEINDLGEDSKENDSEDVSSNLQEYQIKSSDISEQIEELDLMPIDGMISKELMECSTEGETAMDESEFETGQPDSSHSTDQSTYEPDSDSDMSDSSACSILRSPLKNSTQAEGTVPSEGDEDNNDGDVELFEINTEHGGIEAEEDNSFKGSCQIGYEEELTGIKVKHGELSTEDAREYEEQEEMDLDEGLTAKKFSCETEILEDIGESNEEQEGVFVEDLDLEWSYGPDEEDLVSKEEKEETKEVNFAEALANEGPDTRLEPIEILEVSNTITENDEWTDTSILDKAFDNQTPTGIVNPAAIKELEGEKLKRQEDLPAILATSDLREEYQARLDLHGLPADLNDNLPLKASSLSSNDSVDVFLTFRTEEEDGDDNLYASSEDTVSERSSSDSEPEVEFGTGSQKINQTVEDTFETVSSVEELQLVMQKEEEKEEVKEEEKEEEIEEEKEEEMVTQKEADNAKETPLDNNDKMSADYAFENQWFENASLKKNHTSIKSSSSQLLEEKSSEIHEECTELQKEEPEDNEEHQHTDETFGEDQSKDVDQLDMFELDMVSEDDFWEEDISFDESVSEREEVNTEKNNFKVDRTLAYRDDGLKEEMINLCEEESKPEEEWKPEEATANSVASAPLSGVLSEIKLTTQNSGLLIEDVDLEEFEELEEMFEKEAQSEVLALSGHHDRKHEQKEISKNKGKEDHGDADEKNQIEKEVHEDEDKFHDTETEDHIYKEDHSEEGQDLKLLDGGLQQLKEDKGNEDSKRTIEGMIEEHLTVEKTKQPDIPTKINKVNKECELDESTRGNVLISTSKSNKIQDFATPVIIDNGSGYTKAGLASSDSPSVVIPAIIGKPQYERIAQNQGAEEVYVGDEAQRYRGVLKLSYPLEHGIVEDWDGLEKLWDHVLLQQLRIDPSEHPMMLTEAPLNPKKNRERMLEIMMETYQVPAFYIAIQAVLSLYITGKTTGIVVDSGDGVTHIVPVYDGYSLPHATERMNVAGRDMTEYLMRIFAERGYSFTTSAEKEICKDIKEKLCYVAEDFDASTAAFETRSDGIKPYMLPDGQTIQVGSEQFRSPEILFQPNLIGKDIPGVHEYLYKSIQRCDVDIRSELYSNIVLSGGTTLLKGLDKRLKLELDQLSQTKMNEITKIQNLSERWFSVWHGAAILSNLPSFSQMWITADDYYDCGVDIVHKKCF